MRQTLQDAVTDPAVILAPYKGREFRFRYTNWRGEVADRAAIPVRVYHGATEYHPEPQWLMEAWDAEKQAMRVFAMRDMIPLPAP